MQICSAQRESEPRTSPHKILYITRLTDFSLIVIHQETLLSINARKSHFINIFLFEATKDTILVPRAKMSNKFRCTLSGVLSLTIKDLCLQNNCSQPPCRYDAYTANRQWPLPHSNSHCLLSFTGGWSPQTWPSEPWLPWK